ncbi:aspartyl-tRNA(Asn)/glutamyl-tRNA(Gln) amidotransferase subunit A [Actinomadura meyerae]|uniref:Aspartyl-tRNA(Asn)/glutamyl-tRNA(Gln) amidotransferase subunit A n=1 Tax=Actinomadura meyerae TaxID=240840 RepID=A0A239J9U9_9ACTN|nr:amidase [Actinomadura meyerae]SNT02559.1 aspartyl-tRNA(Asn)/glutamyl-tRNA(Gln) amidotransferase subunit A [Actinomadura meyerae]
MGGFFTGRTLADLGQGLRSGKETARDLVAGVLDSADPRLNAFAALDPEGAAAAARRADEELASGVDRGPLHGIPVAVKDIIDVAGLPTGMGSAHFAGHVAEADAACVAALRDAGAVIVGKTGTQEFAFGATGDVSASGPVRNPHDPERMAGGSSSGSAAAVAAGAVPLALGTDTGGSVRIPSAFCGVAGFKPAHGAVPVDGVFPLSRSLDHVGVLAATAADCLLAYEVLTGGPPSRDAGPLRGRAEQDRVAWIEPPAADPEVVRTVRSLFPDAPAEPLDFAGLREVFLAIEFSEAYDVHAERIAEAPGRYLPVTLGRLEEAGRMPGWRLVRALRERERYAAEIAALLDRYDHLVMPTMPITAPPIGATECEFGPLTALLVSLTSPWNVLGLPALTVPAGTVGGLPVGVQLVTRRGAEDVLFRAAARLARG